MSDTLTIEIIRLLPLTEDNECVCGPNCVKPGKHPAFKEWTTQPVGDARYKSTEQYLRRYPEPKGVGARLGNGLLVLDFDPAAGGFESQELLEGEFDNLPATAVTLTGNHDGVRGEHWWYRSDPGAYIPSRPLVKVTGQHRGIDVKGDGGYAVLPPTRHVSGVEYEWQTPLSEIAWAPGWLVTLLESSAPRYEAVSGGDGLRERRGRPLPHQVKQWVFSDEGIPYPQWEKLSIIYNALWNWEGGIELGLTVEEIAELVYDALIRSPDYDPDRPWSLRELIKDARRLLSKGVPVS